MAATWIPKKASQLPEQPTPTVKVPLRDNPLTVEVFDDIVGVKTNALHSPATLTPSRSGAVSPAPEITGFISPTTSFLGGQHAAVNAAVNNKSKDRSVGHPYRLNRSAVKADVLKTFTTNQPISSFIDVDDGASLRSEDQKARMLADRLGSGETTITTTTTLTSNTSSNANSKDNNNNNNATTIGSQHRSRTVVVGGNSQVELITHVEGLDKELKRLWRGGEKVRSTRVAIQAIKMLCSPKVPQCYPSIFVLVSSVMDTFGDFVAKRLQELSANGNAVVATLLKKGQDADADLIPPETVEVCNNWFLKISSIRELVPRICVELSLLKCFRYVSKKMRAAMPDVVERLAGQIRGIADPLVASHIRWYLFLRASEVLHGPEWAKPLTQCYLDQLHMMRTAKFSTSLSLFAPSLQWMLDVLLVHGSREDRQRIVNTTTDHFLNTFKSAPLTAVLLRSLSFQELSAIGFDVLLAHVGSFQEYQDRALALSALCLALVDSEVPGASRGAKTAFLTEIHSIADLGDMPVPQFMMIAESLLLLCAAHFGPKQIHVMLRVVRDKIADVPSHVIEGPLASMIAKLLRYFPPGPLLTSHDLVPLVRIVSIGGRGPIITNLLSAIPSGNEGYTSVALELCRILEQCRPNVGGSRSDEVAAEYTAVVCRTLVAVCPPEAEAMLAFLCEARHTLTDTEKIRETLIHIALRTTESLPLTNRKRRNVAKVFFAFAQVTIPALQTPLTRLKVALNAATIAFKKGLVSYGEGLMKLSMAVLLTLEPFSTQTDGSVISNDSATLDVALQIINVGAVAPPHSAHGHLYLIESLLRWTDTYHWPATSTTKYNIWLAVVRMCTRLLRSELELHHNYHRSCGTANSHSDPSFLAAATAAAIGAVRRCLLHVHRFSLESSQSLLLHGVCVDGFDTVMTFGVPTRCPLAKCAAAMFWRVAKDSMSGVITAAMERARAAAVKRISEEAVHDVVYYDYRRDIIIEPNTVRLVSEESEVLPIVKMSPTTHAVPSLSTLARHEDPHAESVGDNSKNSNNNNNSTAAIFGETDRDELAELEAAENNDVDEGGDL